MLVSAAISPAGPPRQIVIAWIDGRFELVASPALLDELRHVLARPKFRRWIRTDLATEFIDGLADDAVILDDPPEHHGSSPDPDDDYLIALARAADADYLVSGDRHLLDLIEPAPPVITPRELLGPARALTPYPRVSAHVRRRPLRYLAPRDRPSTRASSTRPLPSTADLRPSQCWLPCDVCRKSHGPRRTGCMPRSTPRSAGAWERQPPETGEQGRAVKSLGPMTVGRKVWPADPSVVGRCAWESTRRAGTSSSWPGSGGSGS